MSIVQNLEKVKQTLPENVTLVAVSKTKPVGDIMEAYSAGQRIFGENKIQELAAKFEEMPKDIEWHMIGHVQTNKIKYIAPFVHLIHGVDREKVLKEINKQGSKNNRVIRCLLQVHIAQEETKFGFAADELQALVAENLQEKYPHVKVVGLMGMASNTSNSTEVKKEFAQLKTTFNLLAKTLGATFNILSMGMSGDYPLAVQEGSTMVRVGSLIFGARN